MTSSSASAQRMVHQDFIARIRFSNALPPPPLPPKLLDMAGSGLASGQYTTPGFASRLAREQPLNIEADAELGMPLDLIGVPGVFDGNEAAIQPPLNPPPVHPNDRALLRPLNTLGRANVGSPSVSFLRRTEYISSLTPTRAMGSSPRALINKAARTATQAAAAKRSSSALEPDKDSPAAIRRRIDDGFAATARILADRSRLRHPDPKKRADPRVRCVEALPLLPDLEAFPDSGAFVIIKFATPPISGGTTYDSRLGMSLLRPAAVTAAEDAALAAAIEQWELDPRLQETTPRPTINTNYEFFIGADAIDARNLRAKLDVDNPNRDDEGLYTYRPSRNDNSDEEPCFRFSRLRTYETAGETEVTHPTKYDHELLIGFGGADASSAAAYFYPVLQRTMIRSQRSKNILRRTGLVDADAEANIIDALDVTVADPDDRLREQMAWFGENPRLPLAVEEEEKPRPRSSSMSSAASHVLETREVDDEESHVEHGDGRRDVDSERDRDSDSDGPRASARLASVHTSDEE